nr:MAG TPA: hypothetical protein [Caudoviricetes sp.]
MSQRPHLRPLWCVVQCRVTKLPGGLFYFLSGLLFYLLCAVVQMRRQICK